ncbi:MAG: hypothetical protein B7Z62_00230 [Deltaproteobacteria bacterium 37-65-8]|nr:MAG: hypothetical protein B7Z62_00230 [Deltaproteobacteria bacterium 37-65-8]
MSKKTLLVERPTGGQVLSIYNEGPFLCVELNRLPIGKVRKLTRVLSGPTMPQFESAIVLSAGLVILLTDEEILNISAYLNREEIFGD